MAAIKNNKHNLLHVVGTLGMGGAEMLLFHYTKALGDEKFNHYVYCFGIDGPVRPLLENIGVSVAFGPKLGSIKNPIKFFSNLFHLLKDLFTFIKEKNIQTIHSHNGQSDKLAVVVGKIAGVPAFPTIHNTMFTVDRRSRLDPRVYLVKTVDQVIYRIAECVIAVSKEVKEVVCRRYNLEESKVIVVKNGIFFEPLSAENRKTSVSSKQNKLKLFAVGRLTYQKNFEILVKSVELLVKKGHKNVHVQIAGKGEEYGQLSALIKDLQLESFVELLGVRNDVLELMQGADLLIMPSRYEGLSIAMIEALACSLPVIASDVPGLRDCIQHNENGMLFPVGNYAALAECIIKIIDDRELLAYLSTGAQRAYSENYDLRKNIEPLSELIFNSRS